MRKTTKGHLTDIDIDMMQCDYRRGACLPELADAYSVSVHRCYQILKDAGLIPDCKTSEEKNARVAERRRVRAENCYTIERDLALWLHRQPDIAKVLNEALRLYKKHVEVYHLETK